MPIPLTTRPVAPMLGVEILGVELARTIDAQTFEALEDALARHALLLFRNQSLDPETQVDFLARFGAPLIENDGGRPFQYVSHTRDDGILGEARFAFHSDHAFMDDPIELISLYGEEVPPGCVGTTFVNARAAAAELPEALHERIAARRARHAIDPAADASRVAIEAGPLADDLPHAWHPALRTCRRTGEPILYVSEQQTDRVEGLSQEESRALLAELFAHLAQPRFRYDHAWREGDLVIWDNVALQHARGALTSDVPRSLRRVSVGGTSVIQYFREHAERYGRGAIAAAGLS
ncbi:MAG: TauD/TfdA family dioxygenase [Spirochaetaceae bacterium]|nr:TauD/TfdA family dioxygenase [Myxococcales bacterium]MCB9724333.1 TauD/TfdA family dioxygenase [Spirochaetaceae bacterium]